MRRAALFLLASSLPALAAAGQGYEEELVRWGLSLHGREREPQPEGKRIEEVLIASENIFAAGDPYPALLNLFHLRTKEEVIRRELLLFPGQPYQEELAGETERNLRRLFILAVAQVVPVKGKAGGVSVLVVTRDRWSLRLNSDFSFVGRLLRYLRLRPTEQNFLGLNRQLALDGVLKLDTLQLGQLYQDNRVLGQELLFGETASLVLNRRSLAPEGTLGQAVLGRPLLSLESSWGFSLEALWRLYRRRIFGAADLLLLSGPGGAKVPLEYDLRDLEGSALYTRSFGRKLKLNLSGGVGGHARRYAAPRDTGLAEELGRWLEENQLPRSEKAAYLAAQLQAYQAEYQVLRGVDGFALSEDFRMGPSCLLVAHLAQPFLFAGSRFAEVGAQARYRLGWREGLATLSAAGAVRHQPEQGGWVNQRLATELSLISPPLEGGRAVLRLLLDLRRASLDKEPFLLGGGNGLRGAPANSLSGPNLLLWNLEYRTRPVEFHTLYLGFVLYYDAGAAFERTPVLTHTVGLGARLLFPQFNQDTVRVDFGAMPSSPEGLADPLSASYGQVTDYRPGFLDQPL